MSYERLVVRGVSFAGVVLVGCLVGAGCGGGSGAALGDERSCSVVVGVRPGVAPALAKMAARDLDGAELLASWTGWAPVADARFEGGRAKDGVDWLVTRVTPPPGQHAVVLRVGGRLVLDEISPQTTFVRAPLAGAAEEGAPVEVTRIDVGDCRRPRVVVTSVAGSADGIAVEARFERAAGGAGYAPGSARARVLRGGVAVADAEIVERGAWWSISARGLAPGKYTVVVEGFALDGAAAEAARASAFVESGERTAARSVEQLGDALVYHVMVDRFAAPAPPVDAGARAGGTLDGVRAAIEDGRLARLGVTTLWLSPVVRNPEGRWPSRAGRDVEAYHGYWPSSPREVEPRLGGEAALDALVAAAHARGIRVVLDVVPNHVHRDHPYWRQHRRELVGDASWFNDGPTACVCGSSPSCGWGERLLDCWFEPYLADVDWTQPEAAAAMVDDVAWWVERFDLDGVRIDAVPMMPRSASRAIVRALRSQAARPDGDLLILGENYTGEGDGGRASLRAFLGRELDGLGSTFDFPLLWATRRVLGRGEGDLVALEAEVAAGEVAFAGSGAAIARLIDNHDTPRFLADVTGDALVDPWTAAPPQPTDPAPYARQLLALAFVMTLPGVPVLYYGDEIGMTGANDPDSRRVMPREGELLPPQRALRDAVGRLGRLRRCAPALRRGERVVAFVDAEASVARHTLAGAEPVITALSRGPARVVSVDGLPDGRYLDVLTGRALVVTRGHAELALAAGAPSVFILESSACAE
jgi:glycosidase